jgi:hypothetical protein
MLTFSSPGSIDRIIAEKAAVAGDGLLDGVKIDVYNKVEIINDGRAGAFLRTVQGLSAPLFLHFSTTNMDDPCEKVAELLSPVVAGMWGDSQPGPERTSIEIAGNLVASDFAPEDQDVLKKVTQLGGHLVCGALFKWVCAMSVLVASGENVEGGDPIRWVARDQKWPIKGGQIVLGGAAA